MLTRSMYTCAERRTYENDDNIDRQYEHAALQPLSSGDLQVLPHNV